MFLSVIIPAYNEQNRIGPTLDSVKKYLDNQNYDWEVIVVNNNSADDTVKKVSDYTLQNTRFRIIDEPRSGKGYAVTRGMLNARGEVRLFMDADNATTIDHLDIMLPEIKRGYSVVIGSIAIDGARIVNPEPWHRVIMGKMGNKFIQLFAVWGITDTQRGFKVFTQKASEMIFPRLTIFGWGFDIEVLALAKKFGFKIKEVPVIWSHNERDSKVNLWTYPQVLFETLKVRWNLLTGKYAK